MNKQFILENRYYSKRQHTLKGSRLKCQGLLQHQKRVLYILIPSCSDNRLISSPRVKARSHAPITGTIKMHVLDWLKCSAQNTPTLIQPIEGVHFYRFRSRYRGLCDRALRVNNRKIHQVCNLKSVYRLTAEFCTYNHHFQLTYGKCRISALAV